MNTKDVTSARRARAKARAEAKSQASGLIADDSTAGHGTSRYMVLVHHPGNPDSAASGRLIDATSPELAMELSVLELTERTTPLGPGCYVWAIPWNTVKQWVQPAMEGEGLEPLYRNARTLPGRGWPNGRPYDPSAVDDVPEVDAIDGR